MATSLKKKIIAPKIKERTFKSIDEVRNFYRPNGDTLNSKDSASISELAKTIAQDFLNNLAKGFNSNLSSKKLMK